MALLSRRKSFTQNGINRIKMANKCSTIQPFLVWASLTACVFDFVQDYVKNNILKAEKLSEEKFYANDLKGKIHR